MKKRHEYVSPTLDLMAKKIFSLPDVTGEIHPRSIGSASRVR